MNTEALSAIFQEFAERECRGSSPLYEQLSLAIAEDEDLLTLASTTPQGQPVPNLFFGAVHYLLLKGNSNSLADYYRSMTGNPLSPESAYPTSRAYCLRHRDAIEQLLRTRRVQTNEVQRSNYLFLAFSIVGRLATGRELALVEIGASAGLNLLWDKYGYHYRDYGAFGDPASPVQLDCRFRGAKRPPLPNQAPKVSSRVGLDLNPIDVRNYEEALWLRALVWPEHHERANLLRRAMEFAKQRPPELIAGDGIELLPSVVHNVPREAAVCVFHTHTVNQFSPANRERLSGLLAELATNKEVFFRISTEWLGTLYPHLELTVWDKGVHHRSLLACCDAHGEWIEWLEASDRFASSC
jgi:hypothetical protein